MLIYWRVTNASLQMLMKSSAGSAWEICRTVEDEEGFPPLVMPVTGRELEAMAH